MDNGLIFNIQKFSVHDGPGIRTTVFFKGCSMTCDWCHNPESISFNKEVSYDVKKCQSCGFCIGVCPSKALTLDEHVISMDNDKPCIACETCTEYCIQLAREVAGEEKTTAELLKAIEADQAFYNESGGGVTFSGGEALCQIEPLVPLAKACKQRGIHVTIDTCGHVPYEHFERILPYTDLFLYDIKVLDRDQHKNYTGVYNDLILENLNKLLKTDAVVWLRIPLIKGVNANDAFIDQLETWLKGKNFEQIHLLPYHKIAVDKYRRFGRDYKGHHFEKPDDFWLNQVLEKLTQAGYKTLIGG